MVFETQIIKTDQQKQIIDITDQINDLIQRADIKVGLCNLFILHTTAALTTADLDPGTDLDMLDFLQKIIPQMNFRHSHNPEHTPDHILSSIIGPSLTIPVEGGKLVLGTWQRVVLIELDGPKNREVVLSFL